MLQGTFRILLLPFIVTVHSTAFIFGAIASVNTSFASVTAFLFVATSSTIIYILLPILTLRSIYRRCFKLRFNSR